MMTKNEYKVDCASREEDEHSSFFGIDSQVTITFLPLIDLKGKYQIKEI